MHFIERMIVTSYVYIFLLTLEFPLEITDTIGKGVFKKRAPPPKIINKCVISVYV